MIPLSDRRKGSAPELCFSQGGFVFSRLLPLVLLGLSGPFPLQAQDANEIAGEPWRGAAGVQERTADIADRAGQGPDHQPYPARPRSDADFQMLLPNPDAPNVSTWPPDAALDTTSLAAGTPQTIGLNFTAATLAETGSFPPDSMGAVGPSQFVLAVNGRIRSFDKRTGIADGALNVDTDVFFQSVMTPPISNNFTSDPRIRYDRLSGRWFITIIDVPGRTGTSPNRVLLAVSDSRTITPATVWTFFFFQHDTVSPAGDTGNFADYPTLGIDANALYIGVNIFRSRGQGTFSSTTGFVVRKSSVLGAGPIVVTAFRNMVGKVQGVLTGLYTPQGVDNYDPAATEGYFIGVDPSFTGRLQLRRISNPGGSPTSSANIRIDVPTTGGTITVPHLGNTGGTPGNLDGIDIRLMGAHLRNGRLWTCANIGVDNTGSPSGTDTRDGVRWYELQGVATGQTPSLVQSGTLFQPSASNTPDRSYWMGSIIVSGQGHAAMGFSVAGPSEHINAGTAGRLGSDALGTLRTPALYTASSTAYNPPSDPGGPQGRRWGDYSYTSLDPDDDMTIWTVQEFCNATDSYGLQVAKLLAPPPARPTNCNPSSIAAGSNNVIVVVTGTSTNGEGFFDPGAGFSNRLTAAISGTGITINSLQYTDPTHLTLNLSVSANASSGAHTLTITNPDGQSAASASGILTITGGNNLPTISHIANQSILEDAATAALAFTVGDTETAAASLTVSAGSSNINLVPQSGIVFGGSGANRTVTVTPAPDQFGSTTISLTVMDSSGGTATDSFVLSVTAVNDRPFFTKGPDVTVPEDSGPRVISGWATAISAGTANESGQTLSFIVSNDNHSLFSSQPAIIANGALLFTSATNANGSAIVTVQLHDNGGTANGGADTSVTQTFTINVTPVNDAPVLAPIENRTIHQGFLLTIANTASDVDSPANQLTFSLAQAPAGAVIDPSTGVFHWTPATEQGNSTNQIAVVVTDNGSPPLSDSRSFDVIVRPPPLITAISVAGSNVTLNWSAISGTHYRVQYKSGFDETSWTDLPGEVIASSESATKVDSIGSAPQQRFYRIFVVP